MGDNDTSLDIDSDDEGDVMTPAEVLTKLEEAWLNEKFSPELLMSQSDIVDCVVEQLAEMEENIQRASKTELKVSIHRMEVDRIRFVLSSYLRCRLHKIEIFNSYILQTENAGEPRMSAEELRFATEYQAELEAHLKTLALTHMPPNLQTLDKNQTVVHPNIDSYIFMRVKEDTDGVMVEEETAEAREEIIDLQMGDQHVLRYKLVAPMVASGSVSLI